MRRLSVRAQTSAPPPLRRREAVIVTPEAGIRPLRATHILDQLFATAGHGRAGALPSPALAADVRKRWQERVATVRVILTRVALAACSSHHVLYMGQSGA